MHGVELLHALSIVCCEHLLPLLDFLLLVDLLDSLVQFGDATDAF